MERYKNMLKTHEHIYQECPKCEPGAMYVTSPQAWTADYAKYICSKCDHMWFIGNVEKGEQSEREFQEFLKLPEEEQQRIHKIGLYYFKFGPDHIPTYQECEEYGLDKNTLPRHGSIVTNALPSDQEIDDLCDQYGLDKNIMKKLIE